MFIFQYYFKATAVGFVAPTLAEAQGNCFEGRSFVASPFVSSKNDFDGRTIAIAVTIALRDCCADSLS